MRVDGGDRSGGGVRGEITAPLPPSSSTLPFLCCVRGSWQEPRKERDCPPSPHPSMHPSIHSTHPSGLRGSVGCCRGPLPAALGTAGSLSTPGRGMPLGTRPPISPAVCANTSTPKHPTALPTLAGHYAPGLPSTLAPLGGAQLPSPKKNRK